MASKEFFSDSNEFKRLMSSARATIVTPFFANNVEEVKTVSEAYKLAKNSPGTIELTGMPVYKPEKIGLPKDANQLLFNDGAVVGRCAAARKIATEPGCDLKAILPLPYSIVNNQDFKMHIDMIINGVKNIVLDDKLILYRRFHNKTNISSKSFKTELRESLEFENVMDSFLKIKDINLLEKMFEKEIKQTGIKPYPDTIPYFLGRMAIYVKKDAKKSWGYHKIINFLKDKKGFDLVQKRYGLSYNDFLNLTQEFHNTTFERCFNRGRKSRI